MCVLRRFPVSDEFILDWKMFCVILDRKEIFEISNNGFFEVGHVTIQNMEMSEIALRIEWKHFQITAGPASGRKCIFFQSFRKLGKWEVPKKMLAIQSKLFLGGWNRSGVNRWPGGRAMSGKRPSPPRKPRVCRIWGAGYPIFDLARSGLQGPRVCPAQRGMMALVDTSTLVHPGALRGDPPVS